LKVVKMEKLMSVIRFIVAIRPIDVRHV
jgi:hypothetical protein